MKNFVTIRFLVCGILLSVPATQAFAATAVIPNQFVSGTTALASEVNANFSAVKNAVDDNNGRVSGNETDITDLLNRVATLELKLAGQMTVFIKANGQNIGVAVNAESNLAGSIESYIGISFNEYGFEVDAQSGELGRGDLVFNSTDCSGQAYKSAGFFIGQSPPYVESQGFVFASPLPGGPTPAYFIARGTFSIKITTNSVLTEGQGCSLTEVPFVDEVYPVAPNDPAITAVPDTPFQTPITAGF